MVWARRVGDVRLAVEADHDHGFGLRVRVLSQPLRHGRAGDAEQLGDLGPAQQASALTVASRHQRREDDWLSDSAQMGHLDP